MQANLLIDFAYDGNASAVVLILKKFVPEDNPQNGVYKTVLEEGEARDNINSHLSLGRPGAVIDCQQEKGMERKSWMGTEIYDEAFL